VYGRHCDISNEPGERIEIACSKRDEESAEVNRKRLGRVREKLIAH